MSYKVKILPSNIEFNADLETTVLDAALKENINIQYSCKNGDCETCLSEIITGSVIDKNGNSISSGKILTCSTYPASDLSIETNYFPELSDIKKILSPCKVEDITFPLENIAILKLRLPPSIDFRYLSGQYLNLKYQGHSRSYSIANSQKSSTLIELHISKIENGDFSKLIFNSIEKEKLMSIEGPLGTFFMRSNTRQKILIAGGVGYAPMKAMIESFFESEMDENIFLYWGVSNSKYFYSNEMKRWDLEHENFNFIPVVSESDNHWTGRTGMVHHAALEDFKSLENSEFYICGPPVMVESAKRDLLLHGARETSIFYDSFLPSKS
mgnify:CR=1 FL=1